MDDIWLKESWLFQQRMFHSLGNRKWDDLRGDKNNLLRKLEMPFQLCFGENYLEIKDIKKIIEKVKTELLSIFEEKNYNENFACTFFNLKIGDRDSRQCVFWLQNCSGQECCIDLSGRNYKSWEDFLENNTLPQCYMMYPKDGRHYRENSCEESFADFIMLEESVACSGRKIAKNVLDVVTTFAGLAAAGVLVCNPVGATVLLGASGVTVITGAYGAVNSASRLVDIHKHEGGLKWDSKTVLTATELALTVAGTAAIGASAGIKGYAAKTGKVFSEGSNCYKLANNVSKITKCVSGFNAGFYVIVVIDNHRKGELSTKDVLHLCRIIFFTMNVIVSVPLIHSLISYLVDNFSFDQIVEQCLRFNSDYRQICNLIKLSSQIDLHRLLRLLFPDFGSEIIEKISDVLPSVQRAANIIDRTISVMRTKKFDIQYIFFVQEQLMTLQNEICNYRKKNKTKIRTEFDDKTLDIINKWTEHVGIDLDDDSQFDKKMKSPFTIKEKVTKTIRACCKCKDQNLLISRGKQLCFLILKLIDIHGLKDNVTYIDSKIDFYCDKFQCLHKALIELYYYEFFLYQIRTKDKNITKEIFFHDTYSITDIDEQVFNESIDIFRQNHDYFNREFEQDFMSSPPNNRQNGIVYQFERPFHSPSLTKEEYYEKAKELIPRLEERLNPETTVFDDYDGLGLTIITSEVEKFTLFFHTKGILLFVEDISCN